MELHFKLNELVYTKGINFHQLGRVGLVVAKSVCLSPSHAIFFARVDWCGACLVRGLVRIVPHPPLLHKLRELSHLSSLMKIELATKAVSLHWPVLPG